MPAVGPGGATPLIPRLLAIGVLSVVYVGVTISITAGAFTGLDTQVGAAMHSAWQPSLHALFQLIAELGGLEVTTIVMAGLTFYLWRAGFGSDALVFVIFLAAQVLELYYKLNFYHPSPPRALAQTDGPSITTQLESGHGLGNSFPSGHMLRAVIVYGLLAFVIRRLSPSPVVRTLTVVGATVVIVLLAFDRLYLDVHWESDVIGGLVLGAIGLLAGTVWLDRPRKPQN